MLNRILATSTAAATLTLALGLASVPASADVDGLAIGQIGYNAVGADTYINRNAEYIDVSNVTDTPIDVKGLVVQDFWANRNSITSPTACNTFTVTSLPGVTPATDGPDAGKVFLPDGHTIRVYVGSGTPAMFRDTMHAVYKNSRPYCGYHGHFLNNDRDTVTISLRGATEAKGYDFRRGYVAG